jgi:hypothetical protein
VGFKAADNLRSYVRDPFSVLGREGCRVAVYGCKL